MNMIKLSLICNEMHELLPKSDGILGTVYKNLTIKILIVQNQISPEMQNLYHVRGNGDKPNNCPTVLFVKIWKISTRSFTNIKGLTYIKQLIMAWILKLSMNKT